MTKQRGTNAYHVFVFLPLFTVNFCQTFRSQTRQKNKDEILIHDSLFVWAEVRIMISIRIRHECISRLQFTAFGHREFLPNSAFRNKAKNKDAIWIHDSLSVWAEVRIMISIHEQRDMNL